MTTRTQPLREEHKALFPHIELLRTVADAVGETPIESMRQSIDEVYEFLAHELLPHAQAEERVLYPMVGKVMGAAGATATMSCDHVEIDRLVEELATLRAGLSKASMSESQVRTLRRVLYGLYALIKVHFAKEEEVYLPILEARLTSEEAQHLFKAMEQAVQEAKMPIGQE